MNGILLPALLALTLSDPERVEFARDVRPILSQNCYACHGPNEEMREGRLRLDQTQARHLERKILLPGDPQGSELIYRLLSDDPDERMPPAETEKHLDPEEIALLERWIEQGAGFQGHWSFEGVQPPKPPQVADPLWSERPIDRFILARLEAAGLSPNDKADRRTLLRRATLDLTGLPPTPEELTAFLTDGAPQAYERAVERLFESEAHAERMTLAWMDASRYGDTSVFHADGPRSMWPWRDWVIEAYRSNMPFDRFTVEQLAGDLIDGATLDQQIATGFLRNNGTSDEGGAIAEEFRVRYAVDRVKTVGNVWLGLTTECAQCHPHVYDPISHEEYYGLFAFFNQSREKGMQSRSGNEPPIVSSPTVAQSTKLAQIKAQIESRESDLIQLPLPAGELATWIADQRAQLAALQSPQLGAWHTLGPFNAASQGAAFRAQHGPETGVDLEGEVGGLAWRERAEFKDGKVHSLGLPSNSALYLYRTLHLERAASRRVSLGSDDTIQVWLNGESVLAHEVGRGAKADQEFVDLDLRAGENRFLMKVCNGGGASGFYFKLLGSALPEGVIAALALEDAQLGEEHRERIHDHFRRAVWEPGREATAAINALTAEQTAVTGRIPTVMVMADMQGGRATHLLERGQYDAPRTADVIMPDVPAFLPPLPEGEPRNRLGLARWLVHPTHPLTARVAVNRLWAMVMGNGIVQTVMDFGSQGDWPSHPALLDWLAADFVEHGWDVRRTLREIVTSRTYRLAAIHTPQLISADPLNRLLGHAPRYRLQGEFLRDQALAVSGLLVADVGGPGVKPYQPAGLWNEVSLNKGVRFVPDSGAKLYRKSMYTYWKRSAPHPAMTTFDAPTREKCVVQRQRTNTPLQALVTLNDVQFVEAARHLAARMMTGGVDFDERLDVGFELCTGHLADALRKAVMYAAFEGERAEFAAAPERAAALLAMGESPSDPDLEAVEHAAWTVIASMLLNLDETLNRE
ncbi:MAG TPA: PSD1 and planctomycete cytochrome C domain-containing protein [Planctomycetota bacterium]|nr:PSD1 and planctomycete cytochrome C domain-containing protein [Planctomycetota bacterium]